MQDERGSTKRVVLSLLRASPRVRSAQYKEGAIVTERPCGWEFLVFALMRAQAKWVDSYGEEPC